MSKKCLTEHEKAVGLLLFTATPPRLPLISVDEYYKKNWNIIIDIIQEGKRKINDDCNDPIAPGQDFTARRR